MSQRTRRGPRKVSRDDTRKHTYQGYRFIKGIRKLLARLASHKDCANRLLHYDEYATLLLFYFFNANITGLLGTVYLSVDMPFSYRIVSIWHA